MTARTIKKACFICCAPLMKLNGLLYRWFRAQRKGDIRVQLGPGQGNYLAGWVNVDANIFSAKCDVWADLRNKLPFRDATVVAFYSHHVIEHLPDLYRHFKDVFRCLKPGGVYRVGGPNGDSAIAKFIENDKTWFGDFPDKRTSIGGRFENDIFCRGEHLTILTYSFLEEILIETGFTNIKLCKPVCETQSPDIYKPCLEKEWESDFVTPHTLIIEARKPLSA